MPEPLITIVTPAFQHYRFLKVCVASVEIQGYPNVEHLVLDGGSTDGTKEYLSTSPGCVTWWRSHPDGGQSQALNEGFARASGEWIGWQNSDDFYYPGVFWMIPKILQIYPEAKVIVGDTAIADEYGTRTNLTGVTPVPVTQWYRGHWPYNQSMFFHQEIVERVLPIDETLHFHMDIDFFAKIARLDVPIVYVNTLIGAFRKYVGIKTDNPQHLEQIRQEKARLRERFQREMWPRTGWQSQCFRARHHIAVFRRFGLEAVVKRVFVRLERQRQYNIVRY